MRDSRKIHAHGKFCRFEMLAIDAILLSNLFIFDISIKKKERMKEISLEIIHVLL